MLLAVCGRSTCRPIMLEVRLRKRLEQLLKHDHNAYYLTAVSLKGVRVPNSAIVGGEGDGVCLTFLKTVFHFVLTLRLQLATTGVFLNENRIRQAASSLGAAVYCIKESVKYANERILYDFLFLPLTIVFGIVLYSLRSL